MKGEKYLFVLLLLPGIALAQSRADVFKKADVNGDGYIDAKENAAVIDNAFKEQDANGDGFIDLAEMKNYLQTHVAGAEGQRVPLPASALAQVASRGMKDMDENGDGQVSLDEYRKSAMDKTKKLDRDGDGRISAAEFPGMARP
ncbi:EF-hand domain-containing protein [Pseudoxanthomonas winnipegensis]|uniref:EF-hand domain-containing protein n=1 Tax=Pseudoxanthomonas winnipegensis TaxID=2480810 RepID=A0A4Q8LTM2_9GAMM|nr:EF-hand domain-containing protein [Pseudoxanthomonas winnipegensis]RZZ88080.1 hypothetical protein EA663_04245 [Pseudoxanthomonas winnipegensis]TAA34363.1 hypothetical protein EA656_11485 [Pseudoxanthomonas winnipegensis]